MIDNVTALRRAALKTTITASGCAEYTGRLNNSGYGMVYALGQTRSIHRLAYETLVGPIADGLVIDHLCGNRACWNVAHMEPVSNAENHHRGKHAAKTECPYGHPYNEQNTYINPSGHRVCRACASVRGRVLYAKKSGKRVPTVGELLGAKRADEYVRDQRVKGRQQ